MIWSRIVGLRSSPCIDSLPLHKYYWLYLLISSVFHIIQWFYLFLAFSFKISSISAHTPIDHLLYPFSCLLAEDLVQCWLIFLLSLLSEYQPYFFLYFIPSPLKLSFSLPQPWWSTLSSHYLHGSSTLKISVLNPIFTSILLISNRCIAFVRISQYLRFPWYIFSLIS